MTATLEVGSGRCDFLHVFSCYAPTYAASREEKDNFFDILRQALSVVPSEECYVMLGDFNVTLSGAFRGMLCDAWGLQCDSQSGADPEVEEGGGRDTDIE